MRRFEFQEGSSSKFWQIELSGSSFSVRWGKLGTAGQTQQKDFASEQKAQTEHDKMIKEKTAKGYAEVDSGGAALTLTVAAAPASALAAPASAPVAVLAAVALAPASAPVAAVLAAAVVTSAPKVAPASAPMAVTGEAGAEIRWTADMIRLIHPWRRLRYTPDPIKVAESEQEVGKSWELITEQFKTQIRRPDDEDLARLYDAALQRLPSTHLNVKIGQPVADSGVEAALFSLFSMSHFSSQAAILDHLIDLWVAAKGLTFAVETLLKSLQYGFDGDYNTPKVLIYGPGTNYRYGFENGLLIPWLRLRELLCVAPQAEWDAALAAGREVAMAVAERSEESGKGLNGGLAYLFPDSGIADDESIPKQNYTWVLSCTKVEIWRQIFSGAWHVSFQSRRMGLRNETAHREGAHSMLACLGAEALDGLCSMMDVPYGRGPEAAAAEACAHIPTRAAVQALVQRIHKKEVVPEAQAAVLRWPHFAMELLAQLALNRSSRSATAETMLSQALRRDDGRLIALIPTLQPAQQQLIRAIVQRITPTPDGAPEELHRIFVRPPWLEQKRSSKLKILSLNRLPCAPSLEWKEGQQGEWSGHLAESAPDMSAENIAQRLQSMDLPLSAARLGEGEDAAARQELMAALERNRFRSCWYIPHMPPRLALILWNECSTQSLRNYNIQIEQQMVAVHGLPALPGLLARVGRSPAVLEVLMPVRHPDAALEIASAFAWRRKARAEALAWLRAHPEMAILALIPPAVGKIGKDRDAAGITLRQLVRMGHEALIREVAAQYEAQPGGAGSIDAVHEVLNTDPLDTVPTKIPKMPELWSAAGLARPRLKGSDRSLPLASMEALGVMLAFSSMEEPYGGIAVLKEMCTAESIGDFAWDLLQAWLLAGAPSKEGWAFRAAGLIGNDEVARKLAPMIRAWPGEAQHQRAVTGLDVLAGIGTDVALMHLNGIAQKVKFKGLQEAAREKITQVAETRGLTQEELADRLVPDLGLDEQGSMVLDFGPRQFTVRFDELLRPAIIAPDGKQLPDLPKPVKADDAEKAKEAQETWKALKKDGKVLASQQLIRLESAMCLQRRWEPSVFRTFLVEHPLLLHIVRRLVWGQYDGEGRLLACFRVAEDGSLSDGEDSPFELPEGEDVRVGVAHALEIPAAAAARFGQLFADYEILQPFSQLGRSCYVLTPEERDANSLTRWKGVKVPTGKVLGLANRGWQRGQPQDAGVVGWMERPTAIRDRDIHLHLDPGIWTGMVAENPEQILEAVTISKRNSWYTQDGEKFCELDAITASEIIRAIEELRT